MKQDNKNRITKIDKYIESNLNQLLDEQPKIKDEKKINFKVWVEKTEDILNRINFVKYQTNTEKKQNELNALETSIEQDMQLIEYLITAETETVENDAKFNLLKHNCYMIKNQILDVKNDITSEKIDKYYNDFEKSDNKLYDLESKFEGLGATVITMILSITVISSSIVAIEKMPPELIPLFIVSMVWLGMTFLLFTNFIFRKKDTKIWQPILFYLLFTLLFATVLCFSLNYLL